MAVLVTALPTFMATLDNLGRELLRRAPPASGTARPGTAARLTGG